MCAKNLAKDLRKFATAKRKKTNEWFFKTGIGEYGEHDRFLGISNPDVRRVAKKYSNCNFFELQQIINSKYNEERLCALIILVEKFRQKKTSNKEKRKIYDFYIKNLEFVNNWNLVDLSAPHICGEYIIKNVNEIKILNKLAKSDFHWNRRVCILSTWAFIKRNNFDYTLKYSKKFLVDKEDLMNKAVGWMLREVWKRDADICEMFLIENYDNLSRVTLRYAIEKMEENKRKRFLKGKFNL